MVCHRDGVAEGRLALDKSRDSNEYCDQLEVSGKVKFSDDEKGEVFGLVLVKEINQLEGKTAI